MTETKSFWKRFAAWVTALKDKPLRSARFKLTALYAALTFVVLIIFVVVLGQYRTSILERELGNVAIGHIISDRIWNDMQTVTVVLSFLLLVAITIISYFSVQLTLRPIKVFLESHRRFIADASHELRTPLATMRTEIDVALLDPENLTPGEAVGILRSNLEEIERMSKILTNLLNLASFHDAAGAPKMEILDLAEVAKQGLERVAKSAAVKQVELDARAVESVRVRGNSTALEEVVVNLTKNAIHYSHSGSRVEIAVRKVFKRGERGGEFAELEIRDFGIGIARSELPHVFEPFYRSERSLHMHQSGSGLGLPLVKEIVKRHRGSIHVESAPDKGTTMRVHLPLA